jgi:hypothetical protein
VLVLGGDEIATKLQETLIENRKLERKIAELNTVMGQVRGQVKVLEAKLKDAALAQQSNVPEAILQLRGRWSSGDSSAEKAAGENAAASSGNSGGLGIGIGVGGSSSSEVLQLRAEIEKCVRDAQRSVPLFFLPFLSFPLLFSLIRILISLSRVMQLQAAGFGLQARCPGRSSSRDRS